MRGFMTVIAAACIAVTAACHKSSAPAPMGPSTGTVTAVLSPSPLPLQAQAIAGSSSVRYIIKASAVFRDSTGTGARITQLTVKLLDGQSTPIGSPQILTIDVAVAPNGAATQALALSIDAAAVQTPAALQMNASGTTPAGLALTIETAVAEVALAAAPSTGPFSHVFVVVEENENQADVIGNPQMPYLNGLAAAYGHASQYYADTHPSIGNYFMLTVGNVVTNTDSFSSIVSDDNIVRQLLASGKTWKSYAEDLPSAGYTGGDTGTYARRHNVIALLADVVSSSAQRARLVPFSQFATDLGTNALPNYSFIVPNLCNDGHDCPISTADRWLQANIGPLVNSADFQQNGLLIIVYDEASDADTAHGGGRVPWVAVSGKSKRGYVSSTFYQHESTLRLTAQALGLGVFPNRAASAPDMNDFFIF